MIKSIPAYKQNKVLYGGFTGLDTSRSETVHEVNEHQPWAEVDNAYTDWSGYVSNERGMARYEKEGRYIVHVRFAYNGEILYATKDSDGIALWNSKELPKGNSKAEKYYDCPFITSTISNGEAVFCTGEYPVRYQSLQFQEIESDDAYGATLCASVSGRLALAGFPDSPNVIRFSRVDDNTIFECDEDVADTQVTRAGGINIKYMLDRAEKITALFPFGSDKLLIFTESRCLVYYIPSDLSEWKIVSDVNIYVGCVSQNSIVGHNNEVLFCSRYGIYSLQRSIQNGTSLVVLPYSQKVQSVYQQLLNQIDDPAKINAVFDSDCGRYHVFFPLSPRGSSRLSCSVSPIASEQEAIGSPFWSLSEYANPTCGDFLNGRLLMGSTGGLWEMYSEYSDEGEIGEATFSTPYLWQEDRIVPKRFHQIGLVAAGVGKVEITAIDQEEKILDVIRFDFPDEDDALFFGERKGTQVVMPFFHVAIGVKLKFRIYGVKKQLRIYGFTLETKEQ